MLTIKYVIVKINSRVCQALQNTGMVVKGVVSCRCRATSIRETYSGVLGGHLVISIERATADSNGAYVC